MAQGVRSILNRPKSHPNEGFIIGDKRGHQNRALQARAQARHKPQHPDRVHAAAAPGAHVAVPHSGTHIATVPGQACNNTPT